MDFINYHCVEKKTGNQKVLMHPNPNLIPDPDPLKGISAHIHF